MSDHLFVDEIFGPTIQGEGHFVGKPCYFIRLNGCDQNPPCKWCDTMRSYAHKNTTRMSVQNIIKYIDSLTDDDGCEDLFVNRFVITGGNPCAQDCSILIDILKECYSDVPYYSDCEINIETQGTVFPEWLDKVDHVVVSPKPPSSSVNNIGQDITNLLTFCKRSYTHDLPLEIKVVVFNNDDMQYALDVFDKTYQVVDHYGANICPYYYTLQLGTPMNNSQCVYTVDDMFDAIKKTKFKQVPRNVVKDIRILPQIHNILKVR